MKYLGLWTALILSVLVGCSTDQLRFKGDDEIREKPAVETIGTVTAETGKQEVQVFGVGIVQGLPDTGREPQPGEMRRKALRMLSQHGVENGEQFLASGSVAVVIVAGRIPAGARRGDPFDVILTLEPNDKTTSLRGGQLLDCELREYTDVAQFSREGT